MPLPTDVSECVRDRACVLLARYFTNITTEFHRTLIDDVFEATDEQIRF